MTNTHQTNSVERNQGSKGKGKYKSGSGNKASSSKKVTTLESREQRIALKKKNSKCKACGEFGHWKGDAECKVQGSEAGAAATADDDRGMRSMSAGAVFRSSNKAHQGMKCTPSPRASSDEDSSAIDSDESDASEGRHVELVLAVQSRPLPGLHSDEIEWVLDNGSQVNLCGDISMFSYVDREVSGELKIALGQTEALEATGSVAIRVLNETTSQWEQRRLNDVHYSANAHINLLSLGYMQALGFKISFSSSQDTAWLSNGNLKLKFVKHDMLYRLRCRRSQRLVATVAVRADAMERLHNRLDPASMDLIEKLASGKVDFGLKFNMKDLSSYECVPFISAKLKRMTY